MTPIPDGHPSIEAVHVPGEGVLHPADPDVAPAAPEVPAVDVAPTDEPDGSTNKRRRPRADVAPAAPEVPAVDVAPTDEPDGSTKRRRTTRADAEPTEEA